MYIYIYNFKICKDFKRTLQHFVNNSDSSFVFYRVESAQDYVVNFSKVACSVSLRLKLSKIAEMSYD